LTADATLPCSQQSVDVDESLAGTAVEQVALWLLLEVDGRWPDRIEDAELPTALRAWLAQIEAREPRTRRQFIRQPQREGSVRVMSMLADGERQIRAFECSSLEQVAALPIDAILGSPEAATIDAAIPPPESLFLVCTHGRRDRCCAKHGVGVYLAIEEQLERGEVWQCSHLGGHRFAATAVHLPDGIHYGRLRVEQVSQLIEASQTGRIFSLDHYRGRTDFICPVQAAEVWLRDQHAELRIDALHLVEAAQEGEIWTATFALGDVQRHTVSVRRRQLKVMRAASCGAEDMTPVKTYDITRHAGWSL
jgi:hypothetical protein